VIDHTIARAVLDYVYNHFPKRGERVSFLHAYVAGEQWALDDFEKWYNDCNRAKGIT